MRGEHENGEDPEGRTIRAVKRTTSKQKQYASAVKIDDYAWYTILLNMKTMRYAVSKKGGI